MEYLIKQSRRVKFSDQGPGSRIQPHKTISFEEEKKRPRNWFGKQMNPDYNSNEIEQATAVAAAAFAVVSVTDSNVSDKSMSGRNFQPSFTRIKTPKEVTKIPTPQPDISHMDDVSDKSMSGRHSQPSFTQIKSQKEVTKIFPQPNTSEMADTTFSMPHKQTSGNHLMRSSEILEEKEPENAVKVGDPSSSVTRTPTFTDKPKVKKVPTFANDHLSSRKETIPVDSIKPKPDPAPEIKMPEPDIPTFPKPPPSPGQVIRQASPVADSWERAKLAKIKKRYEETEARITSWENEKKAKARRRLDKTEGGPERKRLKALEQYRSEIDDINEIVDAARRKAKERRVHDEFKVKQKANIYRETGELPKSCFCF